MRADIPKFLLLASIGLAFLFIGGLSANADTYSSTNFKVLDPVISAGAERSTSGSYILRQSLGETALGKSTSSSFGINSGFLTWPAADSSTPSCGDGSCNGSETCATCPSDCGACSGGGGVSGGGGIVPTGAQVNFSGKAYPRSIVTILKDAQVAATTTADSTASFNVSVRGLSGGSYIFSVYGEDRNGLRSPLLTFPINIASNVVVSISGVFIAPSIAVDKSEVKRGENIAIFGQSAPEAEVIVSVNSDEEFFDKIISDEDGVYLYNFDSSFVEYGTHHTKSKAAIRDEEITNFSRVISFEVGTKTVFAQTPKPSLKGDLNNDGRVNLIDFSIAAYWYKRTLSASFIELEAERLNGDGKLNLVDFSIMAYYWTG